MRNLAWAKDMPTMQRTPRLLEDLRPRTFLKRSKGHSAARTSHPSSRSQCVGFKAHENASEVPFLCAYLQCVPDAAMEGCRADTGTQSLYCDLMSCCNMQYRCCSDQFLVQCTEYKQTAIAHQRSRIAKDVLDFGGPSHPLARVCLVHILHQNFSKCNTLHQNNHGGAGA